MDTIYNVDYFIKKFEAIPENQWITGGLGYKGRHCALGHCGVTNLSHHNKESSALGQLLGLSCPGEVWKINDLAAWSDPVCDPYRHLPTPKQRILAALLDVKAKQQSEVKERIVYVTVDASVRELQKQTLIEQ